MDSLLREYERLAKNGDASAERRLIELKRRSGCLDIYIVQENHFEYSVILDIFFSLEDAVALVDEKCASYRRLRHPNQPVKWRRRPYTTDSFHKNVELAYIWQPEDPNREYAYSDQSYTVTCFIK